LNVATISWFAPRRSQQPAREVAAAQSRIAHRKPGVRRGERLGVSDLGDARERRWRVLPGYSVVAAEGVAPVWAERREGCQVKPAQQRPPLGDVPPRKRKPIAGGSEVDQIHRRDRLGGLIQEYQRAA